MGAPNAGMPIEGSATRTLKLAVLYGVPMLVAALAIGAALGQPVPIPQGEPTMHVDPSAAGLRDFDFLVGEWKVRHRRLKERLANNHEWIEFDGTSTSWKVMDGAALVDDNVLELPTGPYCAAGLRAFDANSGQWSIWWLDGRTPLGPLDPPVRGGFRDGVGTFLADEEFRGNPIKVRFQWSRITPASARWEQAFSPDGGVTWETNWEMDFTRVR